MKIIGVNIIDIKTYIEQLESEWLQEPKSFFGDLSMGLFNEQGFERVKNILDSIELTNEERIDRRFVEVTWFMPTFMRWQSDGWSIDGKDTQQLDQAIAFIEQRLTTILGLP